MAKLARRRRKDKTTKIPKNKITTPKTLDIPLKNPKGAIYRHQGKEGQGQPLDQGTGAAAPVWPWKCGQSGVSAAVPERHSAACYVRSLRSPVSYTF